MSAAPPDRAAGVRWRLALGRHAEGSLGALGGDDRRVDAAMEVVYGRGHHARGFRGRSRGGSLDPSQIVLPKWLDEMRTLFPKSVFETVQGHAVDRFGMTELLASPEALAKLEPNVDLMKVLLSFKGRANPAVADQVREIVRQVVEDLRRKLQHEIQRAMSGGRDRFRRGPVKRMGDFDMRATVRANLGRYDPERKAIVAERLRFTSRRRRRLPWTVILCVDQSGSMLSSLIHAVVLAAILAGLPALSVKLVVFDTAVVDLTERLDDPIDLLLSVQLGGGTDIAKAVRYCEGLIEQPSRTVFALITDFEEGGSPAELVRAVRRLAEARVTLIGLAALDEGEPVYDRAIASRVADAGMQVAALTPDRFAEWLSGVMR